MQRGSLRSSNTTVTSRSRCPWQEVQKGNGSDAPLARQVQVDGLARFVLHGSRDGKVWPPRGPKIKISILNGHLKYDVSIILIIGSD